MGQTRRKFKAGYETSNAKRKILEHAEGIRKKRRHHGTVEDDV
jgi:hypothetical protein